MLPSVKVKAIVFERILPKYNQYYEEESYFAICCVRMIKKIPWAPKQTGIQLVDI